MFISGHEKILDDVMLKLPSNYFNDIQDIYPFFNMQKIIKGMTYNDLPCGEYELTKDKKHYIFHSKKLCNYSKILNILEETPINKNDVSIFQSHRGYFSHIHSMTTDPDNSVEKIRNKIITSIISYALLSIYDDKIFDKKLKIYPNALWIGIILHIITDSYSPSHTIRNSKYKYIKVDKKLNNESTNKHIMMHEKIKKLAKEDKLYTSKKFNNPIHYKSYQLLKYEFDINKVANKWINYENIKINNTKKKGDIMNFQYSRNQPFGMHQLLDYYDVIKKQKYLYNKMINECRYILILYRDALITGDIKSYIDNMFELVANRIYRIHKSNLKDKTNKIVTNYL